MPRITKENKEKRLLEIKNLIEEGLTQKQIIKKLKVSSYFIVEARILYGLTKQKRTKDIDSLAISKLTPEDKMVMEQGYENCTEYIREKGPRSFRENIVDFIKKNQKLK